MTKIAFTLSQPAVLPRRVELDAEKITLGRSGSCTVPIDDRFLSRTHAEFFAVDGTWFIRDCGSANGTIVNGTRIEREVELRLGDSIRLGDSEVRLEGAALEDEITQVGIKPAGAEGEREQVPDLVLEESQVKESALHRLAIELIGDRTMTEFFEIIVDHIMEVMAPSRVAIALLSDDGESLEIVKFRSDGKSDYREFSISRTLLSQIVEERKVLAFTDVADDEKLAITDSMVFQGIFSTLCAPLLVSDRVLGVLYLDYKLDRRLITEDEAQLAAQIARVAAIKLESTRLRSAALEKDRMDESLRVAHAIQMRMLPQVFPPRTDDSLFEIAAAIQPAKQVGGDFFEFFHSTDDRLYFCIGDVSGKGMPAALLMAVTRALFRSMILEGKSPGRIMTAVNRQLAQESDPEMFVTAFCGVLDLATGEVRYCNGGHNPPFLLGSDGEVRQLPSKPGLVLGFLEAFDYVEQTHVMSIGDAIYMDTDGISEATDGKGGLFSVERLQELLQRNARQPVGEILSETISAVQKFVGSAPQSDDLTLLAFRYLKAAVRP